MEENTPASSVSFRSKRELLFSDPAYPLQWHLHNATPRGLDINVQRVWERGVTGRGVTAAVVDDGLDWNNADLRRNYNASASWDLNDKDADPMPNTKEGKVLEAENMSPEKFFERAPSSSVLWCPCRAIGPGTVFPPLLSPELHSPKPYYLRR